jgi:hypothetical protein
MLLKYGYTKKKAEKKWRCLRWKNDKKEKNKQQHRIKKSHDEKKRCFPKPDNRRHFRHETEMSNHHET